MMIIITLIMILMMIIMIILVNSDDRNSQSNRYNATLSTSRASESPPGDGPSVS